MHYCPICGRKIIFVMKGDTVMLKRLSALPILIFIVLIAPLQAFAQQPPQPFFSPVVFVAMGVIIGDRGRGCGVTRATQRCRYSTSALRAAKFRRTSTQRKRLRSYPVDSIRLINPPHSGESSRVQR